jgi:flagellin
MATSATLSIDATSISSAGGASDAISALDLALSQLNTQRSVIGAAVNRLTHAVDNLTNIAQNTSDSRSKVEDTDYAAATSELARQQIIQQAATAILAQANQQPQSVLSLLK